MRAIVKTKSGPPGVLALREVEKVGNVVIVVEPHHGV
jgi:hypothetical protein